MALLVVLLLDLVAPMPQKGDDAIYRQAMADQHMKGAYDLAGGFTECLQVANNASDLAGIATSFVNANWRPVEPRGAAVHFSWIGWEGNRAWLQLKTSDATSCLLYRRSGASSFRLLREIRLPH